MDSRRIAICFSILLLTAPYTKCSTMTPEGVTQGSTPDSVKDVLEDNSGPASKLYYLEDFPAFNATLTFTLPLFHFTLPGIEDHETDVAMDGKPFGVIAFIALYFIGFISILVYTVIQKWVPNNGNLILPRKFTENTFIDQVYDFTDGLSDVLDFDSCGKLSVCEAYAHPEKYGRLTWPIHLLVPAYPETDDRNLTSYERAASLGSNKTEECFYKYQCLVQPLDLLLYAGGFVKSHFT